MKVFEFKEPIPGDTIGQMDPMLDWIAAPTKEIAIEKFKEDYPTVPDLAMEGVEVRELSAEECATVKLVSLDGEFVGALPIAEIITGLDPLKARSIGSNQY